jgi:hypothetical protein
MVSVYAVPLILSQAVSTSSPVKHDSGDDHRQTPPRRATLQIYNTGICNGEKCRQVDIAKAKAKIRMKGSSSETAIRTRLIYRLPSLFSLFLITSCLPSCHSAVHVLAPPSTTAFVCRPPLHSTCPGQPAFLLIHSPLCRSRKEERTTLPSSSPVYTLCGMGRIYVIGATWLPPSSREESVWLSCLRSVMVQAPVRSGAKWKICVVVSLWKRDRRAVKKVSQRR